MKRKKTKYSKIKEIEKICDDCAAKLKMIIPHNHIASYWTDICDVCKEEKEVTDPMDYKYLTEDF